MSAGQDVAGDLTAVVAEWERDLAPRELQATVAAIELQAADPHTLVDVLRDVEARRRLIALEGALRAERAALEALRVDRGRDALATALGSVGRAARAPFAFAVRAP